MAVIDNPRSAINRRGAPSTVGGRVGSGWTAIDRGSDLTIVLTGDWIARHTGTETEAAHHLLSEGGPRNVAFDATGLGHWDSALIVFLWELQAEAARLGVGFDQSGLPEPARQLLALARVEVVPVVKRAVRQGLPDLVGRHVIAGWSEMVEVHSLVGELALRSVPILRGRGGLRISDLVECVWDAGIAALPIVTVVNVLVGGILAFVGAAQLRRFGAGIFVADLVGIAVVREMAAVMTAIIMSGRTGGAYAAHVATMQGNEEIDALLVTDIPVFDYLVMPRVLALTCMMPLLYLYGCAVGMLGGLLVAMATLDLSATAFLEQARVAVNGHQFVFGLAKSIVFGAVIAFAGCRVGLRAGRSAADVGRAATSAVVIGIVSVIALDAMFAICADALGI